MYLKFQKVWRLKVFWRNGRWLVGSCPPTRSLSLPCTGWRSLLLTMLLLSLGFGISCVNCVSLRRLPERLYPVRKCMKSTLARSTITESDWDIIPDLEPTTCTGSTVTWPCARLSPPCTTTWDPSIEPEITLSRSSGKHPRMYVQNIYFWIRFGMVNNEYIKDYLRLKIRAAGES